MPLCHHTSTGERSRARRRSYTDLTAGRKEGKNSCAQHWARDCKSAHPALLPRPPPLPWLAWVASPHYHRTFDRALPPASAHTSVSTLTAPGHTDLLPRQTAGRGEGQRKRMGRTGSMRALACGERLSAARDCLRREIACRGGELACEEELVPSAFLSFCLNEENRTPTPVRGLSFSSFRKLLRSVAGAPPARSPSYLSVSESCRA